MSHYSHYKPYNTKTSRRHFLKTGLWGSCALGSMPLFLNEAWASIRQERLNSSLQGVSGADGEILVVLQLAGGNDGLNTLVPFSNDIYQKERPTLAKKEHELIKINDSLGFNSALKDIASLYDQGEVALVQGVGYPNANRSHFASTSIWETADLLQRSSTGWIGRFFDSQPSGTNPMIGISLKKNEPEAFGANKHNGINISALKLYQWIHQSQDQELAHELFSDLNASEETVGSTIDSVGKTGGAQDTLQYLERVAAHAHASSKDIITMAKNYHTQVTYPKSSLGKQLSIVSRLIASSSPTRVYYVELGGFDTHKQQANQQDRLLKGLNDALHAFFKDLKHQGNYQRTTLMTFSEFGRRVAENSSQGTDHGQGSCLFVAGGGVAGGLYGKEPSLTQLNRGDLEYTTDFRSVYATLLKHWLKSDAQEILGTSFPLLKFIKHTNS